MSALLFSEEKGAVTIAWPIVDVQEVIFSSIMNVVLII